MSITLNMIIRDEEKLLPICLKSIKDFVDDIIIIDTGSTDQSQEHARSIGARVHHFEWCDDFSAARNFALSFVKTPWLLWLDADDIVLNPEVIKEDIEYARRKRISGLWSVYKQDESSYQRRLSIFKPKDYTWEGFVHESPCAKRPHATNTTYTNLTIQHRKPQARRPGAALNYLRILEEKDPNNWFGLAESYRFLAVYPDKEENIPTYRRNAEELFFRASQNPGVDNATKFISLFYCARLNIEIAHEDKNTERLEHAIRLLQICHKLEPDRAEPITQLGLVYEALHQYDKAEACYKQALEIPMYTRVGLVLKDYYRNIPKRRLEILKEAA